MRITPSQRRRFDQILEVILDRLPDRLLSLLEEVPLIVEDEPTAKLLREMDIDPRDGDLCGLHWGTPLTDRSIEDPWRPPDRMMLFRGPIIRAAQADMPDNRHLSADAAMDSLMRQVHITLLHEMGHHFGLNEDELNQLGYG